MLNVVLHNSSCQIMSTLFPCFSFSTSSFFSIHPKFLSFSSIINFLLVCRYANSNHLDDDEFKSIKINVLLWKWLSKSLTKKPNMCFCAETEAIFSLNFQFCHSNRKYDEYTDSLYIINAISMYCKINRNRK
jgi:hypothetical protein